MISRREFMGVARRLGLRAGVLGSGLTLRRWTNETTAQSVRTIHLEAREVSWELAPGKTVKAMAYNGRVPGPEIRVREGERVRVMLKNSLAEPTTVHWHGVDVPNPMDGVPGITQKPVAPGETFGTSSRRARPALAGTTRTWTNTGSSISAWPLL